MPGKLILLRHGQSTWNQENRFTGWTDVDLTGQGREEAVEAGKALLEEGLRFDMAFTSVLKRAIRTLWIVLDEMDLMWIPVIRNWRLNERHYGALQGLDKAETAAKHSEEQVHIWRRSYDTPPPALDLKDEHHPRHDPRYQLLGDDEVPGAESLKDTLVRVEPYWGTSIAPQLIRDSDVIVSAHGNSIRAIVKMLDDVSDEDITQLNIPTGVPLLYEFDNDLQATGSRYLGDPEKIEAAAAAIAAQGKAK